MSKKKLKKLTLCIGGDARWVTVDLDNCDGVKGYFLGSVGIGKNADISFHVEAIEVKEVPLSNGVIVDAVNPDYQNRLDGYSEKNEGVAPQLVTIGKKKYFIYIEPFGQ